MDVDVDKKPATVAELDIQIADLHKCRVEAASKMDYGKAKALLEQVTELEQKRESLRKDQELALLQAEVIQLRSDIGKRDQTIKRNFENYVQVYNNLNKTIVECNQTIKRDNETYLQTYKNLNKTIAERGQALDDLKQTIEGLMMTRTVDEKKIKELQQTVAERDEAIQKLKKDLGACDEKIERNKHSIRRRDRTIKDQELTISARDETIREQGLTINARDETIRKLEADASILDKIRRLSNGTATGKRKQPNDGDETLAATPRKVRRLPIEGFLANAPADNNLSHGERMNQVAAEALVTLGGTGTLREVANAALASNQVKEDFARQAMTAFKIALSDALGRKRPNKFIYSSELKKWSFEEN